MSNSYIHAIATSSDCLLAALVLLIPGLAVGFTMARTFLGLIMPNACSCPTVLIVLLLLGFISGGWTVAEVTGSMIAMIVFALLLSASPADPCCIGLIAVVELGCHARRVTSGSTTGCLL